MRLAHLVGMFAWGLLVPGVAHAHIAMRSPRPRYEDQKDAPCGRTGGARTDQVAVFQPGDTMQLRWDETVEHDGHFRVAFDPDGDDDLDEPVRNDEGDWVSPPNVQVLVDAVPDRPSGGAYTVSVTLPEVECERCTLQLIQVMYGRSDPYYYQCADLALRCATPGCLDEPEPEVDAGGVVVERDAAAPEPEVDAGVTTPARDAGPGDEDDTSGYSGGCSITTARSERSGLWLAGTILALGLAWRRRR